MRTLSLATRRSQTCVLVACVVLAGACSSGSSSHGSRSTPALSTTTARGSAAASVSGDEWTVYGHDLANTRLNASEHTVSATTVGRLQKSWSHAGLVGVTGTPVVAGGTAYFDDWTGSVRAVAADS